MKLQLPTYPNITATIDRSKEGLFYEVTLILHITPERGHILYSEIVELESEDVVPELLDSYSLYVIDAIELGIPFFRSITESEVVRLVPEECVL
ncbi:hypothetical protein A7P98_03440 [Eikenella sp. NML080894]|uniref:DUF4926 domain-containing protein n=1 Tax=Eikenella exigua TaxID=2528037 RepID=A0AAX1F9M2_9NEIS|nr:MULTISPECIES: hypothetical protein [Eikenella]OAM30625.1 hypothetical protein A7P96_08600 [Eikenella sp. NML03-A-027]OAM36997.1 hypothetical protein A7P98_03440 [Eikenella sp. NML080894]OAM40078.1 hypothetical protein A7P99_02510 [Eikenella sp. NML120348]OAM41938.1 hypothetical protein A7Q02_04410 [Eikenella sp. NML97-A-109]OAM46212.1 hypothetical protein A7Q03_02775 [Eikenella sp. NML99-0057]